MSVDVKAKAIYDSEIGNITKSEQNWKNVLCGRSVISL